MILFSFSVIVYLASEMHDKSSVSRLKTSK